MTISIHPPTTTPVNPRTIKTFVSAAGVACAAALLAVGVVQVTGQTESVSTTGSNEAVTQFVDMSQFQKYGVETGSTGLSPASTAPASGAVHQFVDTSEYRSYAVEAGMTGLSPASAAPISEAVSGVAEFSLQDELGAIRANGAVATSAPASSVVEFSLQDELTAIRAGAATAVVDAGASQATAQSTVLSRSNFGSELEWIEAVEANNTTTEGTAVLARGNFASDADWIEANGWNQPGQD